MHAYQLFKNIDHVCILRESLRRVGGSNNNNNNFCQQTLYSKSFCYCLSLFDLLHQFLLLLLFFKGTTEQDSCSDRERLSSHQNRNDANKNINNAFSSTRDDTLKGGC